MTTKLKKRKKSAAMKTLEKRVGPLQLSKLLEAIRLSEEWTLASMAECLGVSAQHLSDIEKGRRKVSPERAARFARQLGMSSEQFVRLALQEMLDEAGLKMKVSLDVA